MKRLGLLLALLALGAQSSWAQTYGSAQGQVTSPSQMSLNGVFVSASLPSPATYLGYTAYTTDLGPVFSNGIAWTSFSTPFPTSVCGIISFPYQGSPNCSFFSINKTLNSSGAYHNVFVNGVYVGQAGSDNTVAQYGQGEALGASSHTWGSNFVGTASVLGGIAIAQELDSVSLGGTVYGGVNVCVGSAQCENALQIQANGASTSFKDAIFVNSASFNAVTGSLLTDSVAGTPNYGIRLRGTYGTAEWFSPSLTVSATVASFNAGLKITGSATGNPSLAAQGSGGSPATNSNLVLNSLGSGGVLAKGRTDGGNATAGYIGENFILSCPTAETSTVTITLASPGVVTWTPPADFIQTGPAVWTCPVSFTTTGALPTGLSTATTYWIVGASLASNQFSLADTAAHAIACTSSFGSCTGIVNTSISQSGVQTLTVGTLITATATAASSGMQLTPGNWNCSANVTYTATSATTVTGWYGGIGTSSTVLPVIGTGRLIAARVNSQTFNGQPESLALPDNPWNSAGAQALYLTNQIVGIGGGSANSGGYMSCLRTS